MKNSTKRLRASFLFASMLLALGAGSASAQTAVNAPLIWQDQTKPHIDFILDNSGSMNSQDGTSYQNSFVCDCYPGFLRYDCDLNGTPGTRNDMLVAVMNNLIDTNGSGLTAPLCTGHLQSVDSQDQLSFEYGFFHFRDGNDRSPPPTPSPFPPPPPGSPIDVENLSSAGSPPWPFPTNPQTYCKGGATKLQYRVRRGTDAIDLVEPIFQMYPGGWTPLASSLLYFATDNAALPALSNPVNAAFDTAFGCRERAVVMITDGADSCAGDEGVQNGLITTRNADAANTLYNYTATINGNTSPNVKGYMVGFNNQSGGSGLSWYGQLLLNVNAASMGTDSNADGDNNPNTFCWPIGGVNQRINLAGATRPYNFGAGNTPAVPAGAVVTNLGANSVCQNCQVAGTAHCPGNAYLVATSQQLSSALQQIINSLGSGEYAVSPPQLAFSADGTEGLLASYFVVNEPSIATPGQNLPVWSGHVDHLVPDPLGAPGNYDTVRYDAKSVIATEGPSARVHITQKSANSEITQFIESEIGSDLALTDFFPIVAPSATPSGYQFNNVGAAGDTDDAADIIRWIRGESTSQTAGNPNLTWQTNPPLNYSISDYSFGSVFNGLPIFVGVPNNPFNLDQAGYVSYISQKSSRNRIALVPTNGGTISAINDPTNDDPTPLPTPGKELWAYVPKMLLGKLYNVRRETTYYNDGYALKEDVRSPGGTSANDWQTRAYFAMGQGGNGIVSLNMRRTDDFASYCIANPTDATDCNVWEFSNPDLGLTTARHRVIQLRDTANRYGAGANAVVPVLAIPGGSLNASLAPTNPNNSRYVFFVNALTGDLFDSFGPGISGKKQVMPLTNSGLANAVGNIMEPAMIGGPPANMRSLAVIDTNSDGTADWMFLGNDAGDIYRVFLGGSLENAIDESNIAEPIWQARDLDLNPAVIPPGTSTLSPADYHPAAVAGAGSGGVTCSAMSINNCEARDAKRDRRVAHIVPYWHQGTGDGNLRLVVFFGDPFGGDAENMPDTTHPRGNLIRVIKNPLASTASFNDEVTIPNPLIADNDHVFGRSLLPREPYHNAVAQRIDRTIDLPSAFVIDHKLYYLLYRPAQDPCGGAGATYLACLNLLDGKDCFIAPSLSPTPTPDNTDASVENFFPVTANGVATMKVNFVTGHITFGVSGGNPSSLTLTDFDFSGAIPFPTVGAVGWFQQYSVF